ncbi:hypothetical protein BUALT_Bualt14G0115500 [Buddleja alternifolia]|uniref:NADP-dependent oxidoreductase domain-containing protein n=1 Tax=Buddleja alternifolia TaxID=168488 RepID=A0AAV6WTW3_9LAMI|nr:hypothetical protein BUALT_Bualt14G0115500 [Buddleja alternifolia]
MASLPSSSVISAFLHDSRTPSASSEPLLRTTAGSLEKFSAALIICSDSRIYLMKRLNHPFNIVASVMTFGEQNSEKEAHEQLSYAFERGINAFDTAEVYPVPLKKETQGRTELYISSWLKSQPPR